MFYRIVLFSLVLSLEFINASPDTLELMGQVPGGSGWHTVYKDGRLYAGVGTSIWVYDASDPTDDSVVAKRALRSLAFNIVVTDDTTIFVAANHDGLYALDGTLPDLPILAYIPMSDHNHIAFDMEFVEPDTLWFTDYKSLKKLRFNWDSFEEIGTYLEDKTLSGIAIRGSIMAVCVREILRGGIELYDISSGEPEFLCEFKSGNLWSVEDVHFADLRDDILYVCGGSSDLFGFTGIFLALQYDGDSLYEVGRYTIPGIPGFASAYILNMDSRNDTLFLATMAGLYFPPPPDPPWTDCPVLDGNCLPDSMPVIGHILPGLWFFDVALHDSLPALAIASEWLGIVWMDISDLGFDEDTIAVHRTGGWGHKCYVWNDTLWLMWKGYGVGIFDIADPSEPIQIGEIVKQFGTDMVRIDTLAFVALAGSHLGVYNLAPWHRGGEIEEITNFNPGAYIVATALVETDAGTKLACGSPAGGIYLINPFELPDLEVEEVLFPENSISEILSYGDTIFVAGGDTCYIAVITGDSVNVLSSFVVEDTALGICRDDDFVAVACGLRGVFWYEFAGDTILPMGHWNTSVPVNDVFYRDSLLYASCSSKGLFVLDIWNADTTEILATFPGSGGWETQHFGTQSITLDDDGNIYLCDFHAGCFFLRAFADTISLVMDKIIYPSCICITAYPNPFNSSVAITAPAGAELEIYDLRGNVVYKLSSVPNSSGREKQDTLPLVEGRAIQSSGVMTIIWTPEPSISSGIYFAKATMENGRMVSKKIVYLK